VSTSLPDTFKGIGASLKQALQRGENRVSSTNGRLFIMPSQRARRLSPDEARLRREEAALTNWLRPRP
jgi:hypothetical protein